MGVVVGLMLGLGLLTAWSAWWPREKRSAARPWRVHVEDRLVQAGIGGVGIGPVVCASAVMALLAGALALAVGSAVAVAVAFALIALALPAAYVNARARRQRTEVRSLWPEVVDDLHSAIRAGLSLPEALMALAERGPEELREQMSAFAEDYRASGRFLDSLDALKDRLADPVADRIIEALRLTREVGGSDLGRMLSALAAFLREDLRTRGELESRQSWTINGARLAVAAPWVVLALVSTRPDTAFAFDSGPGVLVLVIGASACLVAYRLMMAIGRLPEDPRVLR